MKIKTKHIITCIKCLFLGLVMALPFFAVLPTALYYGFNEHAISGDKVEYIPTNEVNSVDDLIIGNEYYQNEIDNLGIDEAIIKYYDATNNPLILNIKANIIEIDEYLGIDEIVAENETWPYTLSLRIDTQGLRIYYYTEVKQVNYYYSISFEIGHVEMSYIMTQEIKDIYLYNDQAYSEDIKEYIQECPQEYRTIKNIETNISNQNALEMAFNNLFEKPTFNWVKNSIIASPIYAFVGAFGLTQDLFLSNLVVYWTNILLIYAILNIVLVLFTKLTTLGQKKDKD